MQNFSGRAAATGDVLFLGVLLRIFLRPVADLFYRPLHIRVDRFRTVY